MSKIDFYKIIFFFPIFSKNENSIFKKISIRCINANKIMYFKKVTFFEFFGGRTFLDIYLDIFQLCQNGVFLASFWTHFFTHKCRDALLKNDFDTARYSVSKISRGIPSLQKCRTKNAKKESEKTRF